MARGDRDNWGGARYKTRPSDARGRRVTKAVIDEGQGLMFSQVTPTGECLDLGSGVARVERIGRSRIVKVTLASGDEIRILIPM